MACHRLPTIPEVVSEEEEEGIIIEEEEGEVIVAEEHEEETKDEEENEPKPETSFLKDIMKEYYACVEEQVGCEEEVPEVDYFFEKSCESSSETSSSIRPACVCHADKQLIGNYLVESCLRESARKMYQFEMCHGEDYNHYMTSYDSSLFRMRFDKNFVPLSNDQTGLEEIEYYFKWPVANDFTIERGRLKILEFIATWRVRENWFYCLKHAASKKLDDTKKNYFLYVSTWCLPTKAYPVAQATASVFFTVLIDENIPMNCPVSVTYQFEGSCLAHIPGRIIFREKFLLDILDAKINLFKKLTF